MDRKVSEKPSEKPSEKQSEKPSAFSMNKLLLKVKYSFYSTLIFFIFANPETLVLLQSAVSGWMTISNSNGVPTILGLFSMGALFFITMLGLMMLPSD
jgi:hypothetical protein